jgi:hypothetical protein
MRQLLKEKTTWIGVAGGVTLAVMLILLAKGKIDGTTFSTVMASVGAFLLTYWASLPETGNLINPKPSTMTMIPGNRPQMKIDEVKKVPSSHFPP